MVPMEQVRLLEAWRNELFEELSISEIMDISKKRTKPWVFNSLKALAKNELITARRKANINLYKLNLDNPLLIQTLQYLEAQRHFDFPHLKAIGELTSRIQIKSYCLLAFDSYGKKGSLNVCFLIEDKEAEKRIMPCFNKVKSEYSSDINGCCITFDDFLGMLLREGENIGKQIFREHNLFFNGDIYYKLVKEAHKNGFRI